MQILPPLVLPPNAAGPYPPQPPQPMAGDVTGTTTTSVVSKLQGIPLIAYSPTTGQVLEFNGTSWVPSNVTSFVAGGDLSGTGLTQEVIGLLDNPLPALSDGYLNWTGSAWELSTISSSPSGPASGDLSGDYPDPTVAKIQGVSVATTTPVQSAVIVYDTNVLEYDVRQLTQDDIAAGFTITSFTGGSTVEVGATVNNPAFTASYSSPASSANITNTDNIDSPLNLTTPFTSGTVVGAFTHNTVTSVTFTLTATAAVTKTANQSISYEARSFSGVGTASATGATASGNNATLVGATGTLTGSSTFGGLFSSIVGQTFGTFNPSNQKIYLLTLHTASAHTFKDQNGFTFAFNAPTTFSFTNQNGAVLSMDLYESTNLLSTSFSITVES